MSIGGGSAGLTKLLTTPVSWLQVTKHLPETDGLTTLSTLKACVRHQRLGIMQGQVYSEEVQEQKVVHKSSP